MADEISPISHLEKVLAGQEEPISHLEQIIVQYGSGGSGGSGGTTNYNALLNKPSINGVTLTGNKTLSDLGIDLSKYTKTDKAVTSIELVDAIPTGSTGTTTEKCLRLTFADGTTVVSVSVNDLVGSDEKQKAIVCVVDDDGTNRTSDAYTGMTTWLKDKGIPMNFAICHDTIGTSGKYTVTELQELQAKGNDILIHGNPKLTTLTNETEVISEIESALQFHTDNGLKPTNIYVYPQGVNSDGTLTAKQVKEIVGRYFDYGLNVNIASMSGEDTKGLWNKVPLVDKLSIARMEVSSTKGFDANKPKIDACIENKGLLILFTHSFQSQFASGGYDEFQKIINYLSTQDVEFLTVSKALEKIEKIVTNYDDTQVKADIAKNKSDIADLKTDKQDKTDNALDTTDKTVTGAINEVNGNLLDNVTFSADYKNIIINRKGGTNPYTIPISAIIHNAKIIELNDVDSTDIGDGKTLVYDGATKKHKYISSTCTDELVKMDSTTDPKYLSELIDKSTVVNNNGVLKVKKLDGQDVTIAEINHLKGLTMNVMDLVNTFANGGVKVYEHTIPTYADLSTLDRSTFIDGIKYFVYVQSDETHGGAKTTYICDKTNTSYFCVSGDHRDFTTNPIDLANEVTGKLGTANIDVNALWNLLTINDTYKTLTAKNEPFGTHGAKALYDELVADIGKKANTTDLTTHTGDTNIHITTAERTKWNNVDNKVNKTDIIDNLTSTNADKPLSAKQGKILNDKKVDKTSILTAISASPSDNNLLSEKAIKSELDKKSNNTDLNNFKQGILVTETSMNKNILLWDVGHYYFNANYTWQAYEHIPNTTYAPHVYVTSVKPIKYKDINLNDAEAKSWFRQIKVEDHLGNSFIRTIYTTNVKDVVDLENGKLLSSGSDTGWQRVSTSVADVDWTSANTTSVLSKGDIKYRVKNGVCFVSVIDIMSATMSTKDQIIATGLPIPETGLTSANSWFVVGSSSSSSRQPLLVKIKSDGSITNFTGDNNVGYFGTFSYPVKEQ